MSLNAVGIDALTRGLAGWTPAPRSTPISATWSAWQERPEVRGAVGEFAAHRRRVWQ